MLKRKIASISAGLAVVGFCVSVSLPASAAEQSTPAVSATDKQSLVAFWEDNGVPKTARDSLTARIDQGITPLSLRAHSAPTQTETAKVGVFNRTTETFSDGSIRVADVQVEPGVVTEAENFQATEADVSTKSDTSITNCTATSGSGYSNRDNCLVRGSTGQVTNFFYASYTHVQGPANDQLRQTVNPGQTCTWPYSCGTPARSNYVARETYSTTAGATYTGTANSPAGSQTTYLSISVGNDSAWATFTMP